MTQIKDALREFNPWWEGKFKVEFKEREILSKMEKFLKLPQIIALTGLRRVGKTTLMLKIGEEFVNKGLEVFGKLFRDGKSHSHTSYSILHTEYLSTSTRTWHRNAEKMFVRQRGASG